MRDTFFLRRGEGQRSKKEEDTSFRLLPRGSTTLHDVKRLKELTEAGAARTVSLCRHDDAAKIVVHPSVHEASKDIANAAPQMRGVFFKPQKTLQTPHDRCTSYF